MKKLIIPVLLTILLTSCSGADDQSQAPSSPAGGAVSSVQKDPLQTECSYESPLRMKCGGGTVVGKHLVLSTQGCIPSENVPGQFKCQNFDTVKETWDYAMKFCEKLNYQGFTNWRLPTQDEVKEVFTESNDGGSDMFANNRSRSSSYWLSSLDPTDSNSAMTVQIDKFYVTSPISILKSKENFVRCVREF